MTDGQFKTLIDGLPLILVSLGTFVSVVMGALALRRQKVVDAKVEAVKATAVDTKVSMEKLVEHTNGIVEKLNKATNEAADAGGRLTGIREEQERVAEQLRVKNLTASTQPPESFLDPPAKGKL